MNKDALYVSYHQHMRPPALLVRFSVVLVLPTVNTGKDVSGEVAGLLREALRTGGELWAYIHIMLYIVVNGEW